MTDRDTALREALLEVFEPYLRLAGIDDALLPKVIDGATARLAEYHHVVLSAPSTEASGEGLRVGIRRLEEAVQDLHRWDVSKGAALFNGALARVDSAMIVIRREAAATDPILSG
jgi:hypothetical protein